MNYSKTKYSQKFKEKAVKRAKAHNRSLFEIANELKVHPILLSTWLLESSTKNSCETIRNKFPLSDKIEQLHPEK